MDEQEYRSWMDNIDNKLDTGVSIFEVAIHCKMANGEILSIRRGENGTKMFSACAKNGSLCFCVFRFGKDNIGKRHEMVILDYTPELKGQLNRLFDTAVTDFQNSPENIEIV